MADEQDNLIIEDTPKELRQANPWLAEFALSDAEVSLTLGLVAGVILGGLTLDEFFKGLTDGLKKDPAFVARLAAAAAQARLMPFAKRIGDVPGFIKKFGGQTPEPVLAPKAVAPQSRASFAFDVNDEQEVKNYQRLKTVGPGLSYERQADEIISRFGYNETDEVMKKRLLGIVVARLRDVRDDLETKENLEKNRKIGGLGFAPEQSQDLLDLIKQRVASAASLSASGAGGAAAGSVAFPVKRAPEPVKAKISWQEKMAKDQAENSQRFQAKIKTDSAEPAPQAKAEAALRPAKAELRPGKPELKITTEGGLPVIAMPDDLMVKSKLVKLPAVPKPTAPPPSTFHPLPKEQPKVLLPKKPIEFRSGQPASLSKPAPQPQPQPRPLSTKSAPQPVIQPSRKPSLDDVKFVKKLVGPIEELANLTLIDFRRLGPNTDARVDKIRQKLNLLEKESYGRRLDGVAAWHKNEVNKFYRLLGQASLQEGRSLETIVNERLQAGKPTLSLEELEAVMKLNRELRY